MKGKASPTALFPDNFKQMVLLRHAILKKCRSFFDQSGYIEVDTPCRVKFPGIDPYIDAIPAGSGFYLATSPELQMKRLLTLGLPRIYQITHAFRANEQGALHNSEFSLLEWYRVGTDYWGIMEETEELVRYLLREDAGMHAHPTALPRPITRMSVDELFRCAAGWEPSIAWDEDRFFRDWVEKIDPYLAAIPGIFLYDFPAALSSLAKINEANCLVCERFELYIHGIEIANAFTELTDPEEQEKRFQQCQDKRWLMKKEPYAIDTKFIDALRWGIPQCSGIALGVDRLIMALYGYTEIAMVQTFPETRL